MTVSLRCCLYFIFINGIAGFVDVDVVDDIKKIVNDIEKKIDDISSQTKYLFENIGTNMNIEVDDILKNSGDILAKANWLYDNIGENMNIEVDNILKNSGNILEQANWLYDNIGENMNIEVDDILKDVSETIPNTLQNILDKIEESVANITKNIFSDNLPKYSLPTLSDDVAQLGNTLRKCIKDITAINNPLKAINNMVDIPDVSFLKDLPDPDKLVYDALALALLPLKTPVTILCTQGAKLIGDLFDSMKEKSDALLTNRRRLHTKPKYSCVDSSDKLCDSKTANWLYDDGNANAYQGMVEESDVLIPNAYETSNTDNYQRLRFYRQLIAIIQGGINRICDITTGCLGDEALKTCAAHGLCNIVGSTLDIFENLFDYLLQSAAIHDGEIISMKIDTIFQDRIAIIHNQKILDTKLNDVEKECTGSRRMLIDHSVENGTHPEIVIKINSLDLYIVVSVLVTIILILKCYDQHHKNKYMKHTKKGVHDGDVSTEI